MEDNSLKIDSSKIKDANIININDMLEVYCENDKNNHQARVLQIKEDIKKKMYYVHFIDYEKRMDRWIEEDIIIKNLGKIDNSSDTKKLKKNSMPITNKFLYNEKNIITRKKFLSKGIHEEENEKDNLEKEVEIKNIEKIYIGAYEIETWYYSPYPQEFTLNKQLFICGFCLKYMRKKITLLHHFKACKMNGPPGKEIYLQYIPEKDQIIGPFGRKIVSNSVWEIHGDQQKLYCQNLCLLAKLFLDHKSIYFDVSPFKFFILTENDNNGQSHLVSYFSKENSFLSDFNLACIMVLPPFQRRGYGQFLIAMSYYFSKKEGRVCTPETPLSDLGRISYKSYWTNTLLETLLKFKGNLSIKELSEQTGIKTEDIINTLNELNMIKYWKGKHVIQMISIKIIEEFLRKKQEKKVNYLKFDNKCFI